MILEGLKPLCHDMRFERKVRDKFNFNNVKFDAISPIFKFSETVRQVIYTTNAMESLNATYRKLNR